MPRYRFRWENLGTELLTALTDGEDLSDEDRSAALRAIFGARPREDFVAELWPVLRDTWLCDAPEPRARVVKRLRAAGLGRLDVDVATARGQIDYLTTCRNAASLRSIVLEELIAAGEANPPALKSTSTASAWPAFGRALASVLALLAEDQFLILSVKGSGVEELDGIVGAPYYVQFAAQGAHGLRIESVSNNFLVGSERLDDSKDRMLRSLGWHAPTATTVDAPPDPDGSANYFVDCRAPVDFDAVSQLAVSTLKAAFGVPHPGYLTYGAFNRAGEQIHLPTLGLERELPEAPVVNEDAVAPVLLDAAEPAGLEEAVAATLRKLLNTDHLTVDDDGDVPIRWGSATIYVRVLESTALVQCISVVASDVLPSPALHDAVNELNRTHHLVKAFVAANAVLLTADVYSSPFVAEHFVNVLHTLAVIADDVDDEFQSRFARGTAERAHILGGYL